MFERLIKELKELERTKQISVPIESDEDGYLDRECPNDDCLFQFKVDDVLDQSGEEFICCPNAPDCDGTVIDWFPADNN
jgi:hypothetical protein